MVPPISPIIPPAYTTTVVLAENWVGHASPCKNIGGKVEVFIEQVHLLNDFGIHAIGRAEKELNRFSANIECMRGVVFFKGAEI
ncbi:MAG: hypothetical protein MZV63_26755 [Marinilabiliales bacterium]|nr:hypothetical protein [Marinilabiliales bacterium]